MDNITNWLFGPQLVGFIFIIMGSILNYFPPKHINSFYGYRMPSAQKNQSTWVEANKYSAIFMIKCGFIVLVAGLLISVALKEVAMPYHIKKWLTACLFLGSGILPCVLMIVATERHLDKTFDQK
jgi:uncharacterized membrane protein